MSYHRDRHKIKSAETFERLCRDVLSRKLSRDFTLHSQSGSNQHGFDGYCLTQYSNFIAFESKAYFEKEININLINSAAEKFLNGSYSDEARKSNTELYLMTTLDDNTGKIQQLIYRNNQNNPGRFQFKFMNWRSITEILDVHSDIDRQYYPQCYQINGRYNLEKYKSKNESERFEAFEELQYGIMIWDSKDHISGDSYEKTIKFYIENENSSDLRDNLILLQSFFIIKAGVEALYKFYTSGEIAKLRRLASKNDDVSAAANYLLGKCYSLLYITRFGDDRFNFLKQSYDSFNKIKKPVDMKNQILLPGIRSELLDENADLTHEDSLFKLVPCPHRYMASVALACAMLIRNNNSKYNDYMAQSEKHYTLMLNGRITGQPELNIKLVKLLKFVEDSFYCENYNGSKRLITGQLQLIEEIEEKIDSNVGGMTGLKIMQFKTLILAARAALSENSAQRSKYRQELLAKARILMEQWDGQSANFQSNPIYFQVFNNDQDELREFKKTINYNR